VAYVSGWGNPFTTLLALLAVHAQLSHSRGGAPGWLAAGVAAATLAALSSEGALVVPPMLAALDWVERRRASPTVWIGYALSVALPLYLRSRALSSPIPLQISAEAILRAASFGAAYVRDLVSPWPPPPHGSYPRGGVAGPATWAFVLALGGGVGWLVARLPARQRSKPLLALAWIAVCLAPITAAGMNATPFYAPRALYLPSVGLALLVAALLSSWSPTRRPWLRWAAAAAVLCGVAIGNAAAMEWRDEATVLRRMLQVDPEAPVVHLRLADLAEQEGRAEDSLRHIQAAVRYAVSARDRLDARERLAVYYGSSGRLDEAERLLVEVLREDPSRFRAWMNLGNVALSRGDASRARDCYERALRLSPRFGDAAFNLSLALEALGDPAGAAAARRQAAELGVGAR
jgi:Tfp pilus assembly protein PilF